MKKTECTSIQEAIELTNKQISEWGWKSPRVFEEQLWRTRPNEFEGEEWKSEFIYIDGSEKYPCFGVDGKRILKEYGPNGRMTVPEDVFGITVETYEAGETEYPHPYIIIWLMRGGGDSIEALAPIFCNIITDRGFNANVKPEIMPRDSDSILRVKKSEFPWPLVQWEQIYRNNLLRAAFFGPYGPHPPTKKDLMG